jgi:predicted SprT family Zn-dependent metalloprotease
MAASFVSPDRYRSCQSKTRFTNKRRAKQAAMGGNVYFCPYCLGWHRTSLDKRAIRRLRKSKGPADAI